MSTTNARSRMSAAALCLLAVAVVMPVQAQTAWDRQEQAEILARLQAQGLVRPAESACAGGKKQDARVGRECRKRERRGKPEAPAREHEAGRDGEAASETTVAGIRFTGAGADPR